jgi:5-hydroxyisourate hydrolase-like protein (transthyretin family)
MALCSPKYARIAAVALAAFALATGPALAQVQSAPKVQTGARIAGRILDAQGGLPVTGATIDLFQGDVKIATTTTDANGAFVFPHTEPPGVYSLSINAAGYQQSRSADFEVEYGQAQVTIRNRNLPLERPKNDRARRNCRKDRVANELDDQRAHRPLAVSK